MRVSGQLKEAAIENLTEDPVFQPEGRIWLNKTTNKLKAVINGVVQTLRMAGDKVLTADIDDGQVTTAKLADGAVTTVKVGDNQITTAKILDSNVTTAKIAAGAITKAKLAAANIVKSNVCVSDLIEAGVARTITNLSAAITVTGRPVLIFLQSEPSAIYSSVKSSGNAKLEFARTHDGPGLLQVGNSYVPTIDVPPGCFVHIDTPPAGTWTYSAGMSVSSGSAFVNNARLVLVEL